MIESPRELTFIVYGKQFAARSWGNPDGLPVLALHGWRDNCASFDFLAPLLSDCQVVAPDLAGHGLSDFRSADAAYNIWQDVGELCGIADQLGWQQFTLLGHSRGAAVATLMAASLPQRITRLVLLDGLFAALGTSEDAPRQLAQSIRDRMQLSVRQPRVFATFEDAVQARMSGPLALPEHAALALAARGVDKVGDGYVWRGDPRLSGASEVKLTLDHAAAFVRALACPALVLLGEASTISRVYDIRKLAELNGLIRIETLPGGHHLHMDEGLPETARRIAAFFSQGGERGATGA